jgi:hypothetical protein
MFELKYIGLKTVIKKGNHRGNFQEFWAIFSKLSSNTGQNLKPSLAYPY